MGDTEFLVRWIELIHGSSQLYVTGLFALGFWGVASVFVTAREASKVGQMQTRQTPPISNSIAVLSASAFAMYLASFINTLDETIFYGIQASQMSDPLSWRVDDSIPVNGAREEIVRQLLIKVHQFFGLVGVGNGISQLMKYNKQVGGASEDNLKRALLYFVAGIALLKPDKTTRVIAELIPGFDGIANFFNQ